MYSIYTNSPPSLYIYLPPMYTYMIIMIYDNMICKYCSVHGTSPQLAQADCCHTYTHKQSLRTHVHTPSVSHKTCPYPFSLAQHMSIPLQFLTTPDPLQLLLLFVWNTLTVSMTVSTTIPLHQDPLGRPIDVAGLQGMQ